MFNMASDVIQAGADCKCKTTPVGFEPTRGDPIGLAGRRLSHSAKVSHGGPGMLLSAFVKLDAYLCCK